MPACCERSAHVLYLACVPHAGMNTKKKLTLEVYRDLMQRAADAVMNATSAATPTSPHATSSSLHHRSTSSPRLFFRNTPIGHPNCTGRERGQDATPFATAKEAHAHLDAMAARGTNVQDWQSFEGRNQVATEIFGSRGFTILDTATP